MSKENEPENKPKRDPKHVALIDSLWPLDGEVNYENKSTSHNTKLAYRSDLLHFLTWGGDIPTGEDQLKKYLNEHAKLLSVRTLRRRLVSLNETHKLLNVASPTDLSVIKRVMSGIAKTEGKPLKKAAPLLVDDACLIIQKLDGTVNAVRDKALILTGWALFLRRSELVGIRREDIRAMKDRYIVTITTSKTDTENAGNDLSLPKIGGPACPVAALEHWLTLSGIESGPIFRRVFKGGSVGKETQGLTAHSVNNIIKQRAMEAGVDNPLLYSGHSFRRGGITQSYDSGMSESDIQQVSRHRSLVQLRDYRDAASSLLGTQPSNSFLNELNTRLQATD